MKFKETLWLAIGLIGLALFYFLFDLPQEKAQKEEQERSEKVLLFEPGNVEEFSVTQNDKTVTVKRKDEKTWTMTMPVEAQADNDSAASYLSQLQSMRFSRVVEESSPDLSVFGLAKPSLTLSLKLKDKNEIGLLVGDDSPLGHSLYIQRRKEQKVLLTQVSRKSLETSAYDLRDKTVLEFATGEISLVEIRRHGSTLKLGRTGETWSVTENKTATADHDEVENLLNTLRSARVKRFVEEKPETLAAYGLASPAIELTLKGKETQAPLTLFIGTQKDSNGYYGQTGGKQNIVLLDSELIHKLSRGMTVYMDKKLADFKEDDVTELRLRGRDENIHLRRDAVGKNQWTIEEPLETPASTASVNSLLFDLKSARIKEFIDVDFKDPKLFGLLPAGKELEVSDKTGKIWSLKLGNKSNDEKFFFAQRSGEPVVFALEDTDVKKIFRSLHDLKNRKILKIKTDEVSRILLKYPDHQIELKRDDKEWDLLQPEVIRKVKSFHANDILWTLNALEYDALVSPPEDGGGLNNPATVISLWDKNNREIESLAIGGSSEKQGRLYARVEGKDALYLIPPRFLDEIPKNSNKFKE